MSSVSPAPLPFLARLQDKIVRLTRRVLAGSTRIVIARHTALVERLRLATLTEARLFRGELIKDHKGRRDIFRIPLGERAQGDVRMLFLKRNWKPYRKDGLASLIQRGTVWSAARREWENGQDLQAAGLQTAGLVAYGEDCGPLWERFSFLVTEAATGSQTVDQFLRQCRDWTERKRVFSALAREVRRMHAAGLATPDLFTRHVFVNLIVDPPQFCWIDMARLDRARPMPMRWRARDLAALNITAPLRFVAARERLRFLIIYAAGSRRDTRTLFQRIERRMKHLLARRKFRDFGGAPAPAAGPPAARIAAAAGPTQEKS